MEFKKDFEHFSFGFASERIAGAESCPEIRTPPDKTLRRNFLLKQAAYAASAAAVILIKKKLK